MGCIIRLVLDRLIFFPFSFSCFFVVFFGIGGRDWIISFSERVIISRLVLGMVSRGDPLVCVVRVVMCTSTYPLLPFVLFAQSVFKTFAA